MTEQCSLHSQHVPLAHLVTATHSAELLLELQTHQTLVLVPTLFGGKAALTLLTNYTLLHTVYNLCTGIIIIGRQPSHRFSNYVGKLYNL